MTWQVTWYEITTLADWVNPFGKQIGTSKFEDLNFNFKWGSGVVFDGRTEGIGFRATTRVIPLSNKLTIIIGANNGSRLFFDDKKVIDNWRYYRYGHRRKTATVEAIPFKPTKLTYEWYEWRYEASAEFEADTKQMQTMMGVFPLNLPPIAKAIDIVALPFDALSFAINPNAGVPETGAVSSKSEEIEIFS